MKLRRRFALPALALALVSACGGEPETPRHLILVTVDTLRADHLSAWGYARPTSAAAGAGRRGSAAGFTLDELAAQGVRCASAFAPIGMTFPSVSSLMTGRAPSENCTLENGNVLSLSASTLAETLQAQGFDTAAFTTNKLLVAGSGIEQGFGHFASDFSERRDELALAAAEEWLAARDPDSSRVFVWIHLMGPHLPYTPPPHDGVDFARLFTDPAYRGPIDGSREALDGAYTAGAALSAADVASAVALYDGEVARIDCLVSRFARSLAGRDWLATSLLVIAADHGEELHQRNAYWAHSKSVYGSVLHVPLLFRHPATLEAGVVVPDVVALQDVGATALDLLGLAPAGRGHSLRPLLDRYLAPERAAFGQWRDRIFTVRDARWRLVSNPGRVEPDDPPAGSYPVPERALFDVRADPEELVDVAARHSDVVERLLTEIDRWRAGLAPCTETLRAPDAERARALQDLGYADGAEHEPPK